MALGQILLLTSFALLLSLGQILFKRGADSVPPIAGLGDLPALAASPVLWLAVGLYGGATLLWIYILQQVPLSRAYPFAALGFVLVPLFAWSLFGEALGLPYLVGALLIVAGISVIAVGGT